jgi:hypothetical protein
MLERVKHTTKDKRNTAQDRLNKTQNSLKTYLMLERMKHTTRGENACKHSMQHKTQHKSEAHKEGRAKHSTRRIKQNKEPFEDIPNVGENEPHHVGRKHMQTQHAAQNHSHEMEKGREEE